MTVTEGHTAGVAAKVGICGYFCLACLNERLLQQESHSLRLPRADLENHPAAQHAARPAMMRR